MNKNDSESLRYLSGMDTGVLIFCGSGRSGKSCTMHSMLDLCFPDRQKYLLESSDVDVSIFPNYGLAHDVDDIPIGAIAIIEDVNRVFGSRKSGSNNFLPRWIGIASHKSNIIALSTQNTADTDVAFTRAQDCLVIHKRMGWEDLSFERPERRTEQMVANEWIDRAIKRYPNVPEKSWTFVPRFNEIISVKPVSWWCYENSHLFRHTPVGGKTCS